MRNFLFYIGESIKENWNASALSNYGAKTFTYGDVASFIKRYHILFELPILPLRRTRRSPYLCFPIFFHKMFWI